MTEEQKTATLPTEIDCNHIGHYSDPVQSVVDLGGMLMIIITTTCHNCAKVFTMRKDIQLESKPQEELKIPEKKGKK